MDKVGIPMHCEKRMIDVSLSPRSDEPKQWNDMISYHVGSVPTGWWYGATYEKLTPERILKISLFNVLLIISFLPFFIFTFTENEKNINNFSFPLPKR